MTPPIPIYRALALLREYHSRAPVRLSQLSECRRLNAIRTLGEIRLALDHEIAELHAAGHEYSRCGIRMQERQ